MMHSGFVWISLYFVAIASITRCLTTCPCSKSSLFYTSPRIPKFRHEYILIGSSQKANPNFPYNNIRLPKDISPQKYKIYLKPDLKNFIFTGYVVITFTCIKETKYVILHKKKLDISSYNLTDSRGKSNVEIVKMLENQDNEQILFEIQTSLEFGKEYKLRMEFNGTFSNTFSGFYISSYKTRSGETRYLATTQFQPTDARAAFPCFDEPEFKAVFQITISHDKRLKAISNMPVDKKVSNGNSTDTVFKSSVKMSTYLVAFIVSDYAYTNDTTTRGTKINVWADQDNINNTRYALKVATKVLTYFEDYFKIPFPIPKLDLVAVPDFNAGAMENWGLMIFKSKYLLSNPASATVSDQFDVTLVVAHELAHQWFGNLVTLEWWDDLWLNEGFANYMEYIGMDHYDKSWKVMDIFVLNTLMSALKEDSRVDTHPITVQVSNPKQIGEIFDDITYDKGASVIRMLSRFLGPETFQKGIQKYLKENKYESTKADDLWKALSIEDAQGLDVKSVMETWIQQKGYPVIQIKNKIKTKRNGITKVATQTRFICDLNSSNPEYEKEAKRLSWYVPLSYTTSESPDQTTLKWMNKTSVSFTVPSGVRWIKANVEQTGTYRVNYDNDNWKSLIQQLNDNHTVLDSKDRSGLLDDSWALAKAKYLNLRTALDITSYLSKERDYVPFATGIIHMKYLGDMLGLKLAYLKYQQYITSINKPLLKYVGWSDTGDFQKRRLRQLVISTLSYNNEQNVVAKCLQMFREWMKNEKKTVPAHLLSAVYLTAGKFGGKLEWTALWKKYQITIDPAEKDKILNALSSTLDIDLRERLLSSLLDGDKIKNQDTALVLCYVSQNPYGRTHTWEFFKKNFKKFSERVINSQALGFILSELTQSFNEDHQMQEVKDLIEQHKDILGSLHSKDEALKTIRFNINWMKENEKVVTDFLIEKTKPQSSNAASTLG